MIEGVRLLPWIAAQERIDPAARPYDCKRCKASYSVKERSHLRCGWIKGGARREEPEADRETIYGEWARFQTWRGVRGASIGGRLGPAVCPGYSVRLPEVQEVCAAWAWEKRGVLELHVRERELALSELFLDMVDLFAGEAALAQSWELAERNKRASERR